MKADIADNDLLTFICAVAVLYLRATGPYWELVQSRVTHSQFHSYVQKMEACFERWAKDPSEMLSPSYVGIFDGKFELKSDIAPAIYNFVEENFEAVSVAIRKMLCDMLVTTKTQLKDFLKDGKYGTPPSEDQSKTLHLCPLTNLIGENAFGNLDFDINKRRHASLHHRSTSQMWRANKTDKWLTGQGEDKQARLLAVAREKGSFLRKNHQQQEKIVSLKVREKILENKRLKKEKEKKN